MRALITGISGQDGSYLCEHLLALGYEVHGVVRPAALPHLEGSWIGHLVGRGHDGVTVHPADLTDAASLLSAVGDARPDEVYNLAAQSRVGVSFAEPLHTAEVTGMGAVRLLDAVRQAAPAARVFQAGSADMFGAAPPPQDERSPFDPRSPYAAAKLAAHYAVAAARHAFGMFAVNGICFNHESPRRGPEFVTRKITRAIPRLLSGEQRELRLGTLDIRRDWGHARDHVVAMHLMLQQDTPLDLVLGTGRSHSLGDFVAVAFEVAGLDWRRYVRLDPALSRAAEVPHTHADPSRAREVLGWEARIGFDDLVAEMVEADLRRHRGG